MSLFTFNAMSSALKETRQTSSGVDFTGKSLKLDSADDAKPIVEAINACANLHCLALTGNTLGVAAAEAIAGALGHHPELREARFSDMFTGRLKTEIPPALSALGAGMIKADARLTVLDLSNNAFGAIGVEGVASLLQSEVCSQLEELRLENNGLGITGGKLLATALGARRRRLKTFIAGRNRLENDGATALAAVFKEMGSLEVLALPQNGIYHAGVSALCSALAHNSALAALDLNDNTVGGRGAAAVARTLSRLKNLKSINFGDCLLKSKGARTLAKAIKDNLLPVESVDLSHNEIGRVACMEVVDALAAAPGSGERLARVVLAGNSLGGADNKRIIRQKLGDCAELSDGDDSDTAETDSEDESQESDSADDDDDDDDEEVSALDESDTRHSLADEHVTLVTTASDKDVDVERFLREPTAENLAKLGQSPADVIDAHLQGIAESESRIETYVQCVLLASSLPAASLAAALYARAPRHTPTHALRWMWTDALLRGLALVKSESRAPLRWSLAACYVALADTICDEAFPHDLREVIRFFISSKLTSLPADVQDVIKSHPSLLS